MNKFERVETKYVLTKNEYDMLMKKIKRHILKDEYYKSTINNIYFDTDNYDLINASIDKPKYKEKVRLRSYNTPKLKDDVFFEIKTKLNGVVYKRRIKIKLFEYYEYLINHNFDEKNQIMKEIDYIIKKYNLKPKLMLSYDRTSYYDKNNKNFRITFDQNIRSRNDELNLEYGDAGELYFEDDMYVMELKTLGGLPMWFTKILSSLKIYPKSFSKYGNIYKKERGVNYV